MEETEKMENQHSNNIKKPCIQPPLDYPWFLFREFEGTAGYIYSPTSTLYKGFSTSFPDDLHIQKVLNCCYGWLILSTNPKNILYLWNPVLSRLIKFPRLEMKGLTVICGAVLSSPGNRTDDLDPNCRITLVVHNIDNYHLNSSRSPYSIVYCLVGDKCWNVVYYDSRRIGFKHPKPIVMNDVVYVEGTDSMGVTKLFCMNKIDSTGVVLTEYCKLPRYPLPYQVSKEGYLVESCGQLFYIIVSGSNFNFCPTISSVEAFELDQVRMKWNKMSEVGDRVFFLDGTYSSVSRAIRENEGGFLYYYSDWVDCWYSYNFVDNSFSTFLDQSRWQLPDGFHRLPIIYFPDRRLIDEPEFQMNSVETGQYEVDARKSREESKNSKIYDHEKIELEALLFCLPDDLVKLIFRIFLNPVDYLNFSSASKICRLLAPKVEWRRSPMNLAYASPPISPWLVSFNNHSNTYHFVDSEFGGKYLIRAPKSIMYAKIIHSKNGWLLLMSSSYNSLSFYNPLTTQIIKLPTRPLSKVAEISFSSSPTTSNCLVVAIDAHYPKIVIHVLQVGKKRWNTLRFGEYFDLHIRSCPVFHDGGVYVLASGGSLLELKLQNDKPLSLNCVWSAQTDTGSFRHKFLLECDGKFLKVSISETKSGGLGKVIVLHECLGAPQHQMLSWEKIDNLGNHSLYLSKLSCFSTTARADWMKNKIFLTRVYDDHIVYYFMETGKYYRLANKDNEMEVVEYDDTREILMSAWIQPSWS